MCRPYFIIFFKFAVGQLKIGGGLDTPALDKVDSFFYIYGR